MAASAPLDIGPGRRDNLVWVVFFGALLLLPVCISAMPEYSERTGEGCGTCHLEDDGGPLSREGLEYAASGYTWPPEGGYRVLGPMGKYLRLLVGFLHLAAAFIWFGAILYVHILLRPGYASKGLPKGEVVMGLVSMVLVGITGVLLTVSRVKGLDVLYSSRWGMVLSIKIILYVVMVSGALVVVTFVGPRLKRRAGRPEPPAGGIYDPLTLSWFDGKEGRPPYVAYRGEVYDMSGLELWRDGTHMKHRAGEDLSDAMKRAPHGDEKLEPLKVVGSFDAGLSPPRRPIEKVFYFIAYMNLVLVFSVLFVISYWRWGL